MPIAINAPILQARIIIHTRPAVISALLLPASTAVVACAEPSAVTRVNVAALVRHVADLVGAALAAAGTAARLILDRGGGAAARLCRELVVTRGAWEHGRGGDERGRRACRSQCQRWSGKRSMHRGGRLHRRSAVEWLAS
jgi:hypothetical protein